mmetsp:Transcript_4909/g.7445  ORF Transcript_4909/g.7445 Transcript_4909/m.7445 type:complete len:256 (+) Transcript_4909:150-917(+)
MGDAHFTFKVDSGKDNHLTQNSNTEELISMVNYYTHSASPRGVEAFDQQSGSSTLPKENAPRMATQIHDHAESFISTITMYTVIFTQHHGRTTIHLHDLKKSLEFFSRTDMKPSLDISISALLRDEAVGEEDDTLEWTETSEDIHQMKADEDIELEDPPPCCGSSGEVADFDEDTTPVTTIIRSIDFSVSAGDTTCMEEDASKGIPLDKIHTMWDDSVRKEFQSTLRIRDEKRFFLIVKVFMDAYIKAMIVRSQP